MTLIKDNEWLNVFEGQNNYPAVVNFEVMWFLLNSDAFFMGDNVLQKLIIYKNKFIQVIQLGLTT